MCRKANERTRNTVTSKPIFAQICTSAGLSAKHVVEEARQVGMKPEEMAKNLIRERKMARTLH